jgi:hypothetical protein
VVAFNGPEEGETNLDNLAWTCWGHHHACHEGHWVVTGKANDTLWFHPPGGGDAIASRPHGEARLAA